MIDNQLERQRQRSLQTLKLRDSLPGENMFEKQGVADTMETYASSLREITEQHDYNPANTYWKMVEKLSTDLPHLTKGQINDYLSKMDDDDDGDDSVAIPGVVEPGNLNIRQESPWPELNL
jgi:hypothetical protein